MSLQEGIIQVFKQLGRTLGAFGVGYALVAVAMVEVAMLLVTTTLGVVRTIVEPDVVRVWPTGQVVV